MPIDTSIYSNIQAPKIQNPFEIAQGAAQIQGLQQKNRLADLTYGQQLQDVQSQNALSQLLSQGKSGNDVVQGLAQQGFGKQGLAYGKAQLDQQKTQADIDHTNAQTGESSAKADAAKFKLNADKQQQAVQYMTQKISDPNLNVNSLIEDMKRGMQSGAVDPKAAQAKIDDLSDPKYQDPEVLRKHIHDQLFALVAPEKKMENETSIANNIRTNQTSRANNAATIQKDLTIAGFDKSGNPTGDMETTARAIANGQLPPPSGMALTNPKNQRILSRVMEINPNYDFTDVTAKKKAASDFTSGNQGNALRSFAVAGQHLDQLGQLVDALDNGNSQLVNKYGNMFAAQTGNPAPTNFDAAKDVVAKEVMKAIVGGGGGVAEREELAKSMSQANSPAQLKGVIKQYRSLMSAQHDALLQQRRAAGLSDSTLPKYSTDQSATPALPPAVQSLLDKYK